MQAKYQETLAAITKLFLCYHLPQMLVSFYLTQLQLLKRKPFWSKLSSWANWQPRQLQQVGRVIGYLCDP